MNTETISSVTAGATPVQMVILICIGGVFLWGVISLVRWLIQIKTKHLDDLPRDIKEIKDQMYKSAIDINAMNSKLWSEEKIHCEFNAALEHHKNTCPAWRYHCANRDGKKEG